MTFEAADPLDVALGLAIRRRRREKGFSQTQLGAAIGVSFQQVQKYERGANRTSVSTLLHICSALDTTFAEIVGEVERHVGGRRPEQAEASSLYSPEAPLLLEAFSEIRSGTRRRAVLDLVRNLARDTEEAKARAAS